MRVHIDRGGTFTDIVRVIDGVATIGKIPSDEAIVGELGDAPETTFGTTVATNALLERAGVATLLIVSPGFEDLVVLRDMARPALFDPDAEYPATLATSVTSDLGCEVSSYTAIAIVLFGSGDDPSAELACAAAIASRTSAYLALGHRVSRDKGYLARIETTLVDAAITPVLMRSMQRDRIPAHWLAMRSDGSLVPAAELRAHEAVLSGPAGGVLATLATAQAAGFTHAVGLDMGGTSTDVCIVEVDAGLPLREGDIEVAGVRLRRAMLEVETIAAGGGSILASDVTGLTVGPRSAGADPGPQCYGRGGPPTITDAALASGLIDPSHFPFALHPDRVALPGPAEAFIAIARESMAQAVRRVAMARGIDLGGLTQPALVAYGGAGGQHAAAVAELLGITTVLVHPAASVFCAFGQSLARRSETRRAPLWGPLSSLSAALPERFAALADELPRGPTWQSPTFAVALGHGGTDHPIEIAWTPAGDLIADFTAAYTTRFGFAREGALDVFGLVARVHAHALAPAEIAPFPLTGEVLGPTVLHAPTTSVEVPRGWRARLERGLLRLDRTLVAPPDAHRDERPELWHNRLTAIAVEAGVVLARLARSVSIKERLDFSCAIFDARGQLITNAPHIPVHLGAMGDTVRDVVAAMPAGACSGDAWLSNDPAAGGSHLPDLTVVTLVLHDGQRFFVASRGHHVDVGGLTPGSIPVASRMLADEGIRLSRVPLVAAGVPVDLRALVLGSRQPDVVAADLEAQLAANAHMARRLRELPAARLTVAMTALFAHARGATEALIARLPRTPMSARDDIDGVPLVVTITVGDRLVIDFGGTGGPHPGNLNAPPAVVRAAVLYALRLAIGVSHLPLNDGTLAAVDIVVPAPSIVAPQSNAAIVGGNVETSQRIVDLILSAFDLRAASAGTMNNLVLGRAPDDPDPTEWAFYETLGAGFGATATGPGRSARQLHMTNTRATDPEVLAARLPVAVCSFAVRHGSGGIGHHRGGDGLVRELVVTRPALASLLAAWRPDGAPGLHGGGNGAPGRAFLIVQGVVTPWDGHTTRLEPGTRVRVETPGGGAWGCMHEASTSPPQPSSAVSRALTDPMALRGQPLRGLRAIARTARHYAARSTDLTSNYLGAPMSHVFDRSALDALFAADAGLGRLFAYAKARMSDDPGHDLAHCLRVAQWTVTLGLPDGVPPREAVAAALLHDIVNVPKNHPDRAKASTFSAEVARAELPGFDFDAAATERVAGAIRDHSYSRGGIPETPLGEALQDADRLEALGVIGLFRTISTGTLMGARYFEMSDPWATTRPLDDLSYSIDHFETKLLKLPATLRTAAGRAEAERRAAYLRHTLGELAHELGMPLAGAFALRAERPPGS